MDPRARRRRAGAALWLRAAHLRSARPQAQGGARARQGRCHHRHRQRQQAAHGAGAAAGARARSPTTSKLCPYDLPADGPLFVGARGGPLSPRIVQLAMARLRGALGLPETRDAACAAAFVRDASAGARRRPARDPGAARPRLAVDHADLYRGRRRAADGRLPQRASARLNIQPSQSLNSARAPLLRTAMPSATPSSDLTREDSAMSHGVHAVQHEAEHKMQHDSEHGDHGGAAKACSTPATRRSRC